jgi:hypothetical protein
MTAAERLAGASSVLMIVPLIPPPGLTALPALPGIEALLGWKFSRPVLIGRDIVDVAILEYRLGAGCLSHKN